MDGATNPQARAATMLKSLDLQTDRLLSGRESLIERLREPSGSHVYSAFWDAPARATTWRARHVAGSFVVLFALRGSALLAFLSWTGSGRAGQGHASQRVSSTEINGPGIGRARYGSYFWASRPSPVRSSSDAASTTRA